MDQELKKEHLRLVVSLLSFPPYVSILYWSCSLPLRTIVIGPNPAINSGQEEEERCGVKGAVSVDDAAVSTHCVGSNPPQVTPLQEEEWRNVPYTRSHSVFRSQNMVEVRVCAVGSLFLAVYIVSY